MQSRPATALSALVTICCLIGCNKTEATPSQASDRSASPAPVTGSTPELELTRPDIEAPTLAPPAAAHPVGERGVARDYFMTLISVKECRVEPHFKAKPGHLKLGLEVLLEGRTQQEVPTNPFSATLRDDQDREYSADLAGCTPTLRADRITLEKRAHGFITFEIPSDATGLRMKYSPFVMGVGAEELEFSLGR